MSKGSSNGSIISALIELYVPAFQRRNGLAEDPSAVWDAAAAALQHLARTWPSPWTTTQHL